jgi:glycosyltransferase involved in cell wall biosynthesis
MSLTIAIPSYNKEQYLERCINSVLLEKDQIDRIILVDNCSSDKTFDIGRRFAPLVECYRNETNLGMSGNFNRCIELCETEWLMIVHADDELIPGAIKKYMDLIERYPTVGLIHADSYSVLNSDYSTKSLSHQNKKEFWKAGVDALSCSYGVCSAVMVKKSVYDKLGSFIVSSLSSDVEMWARIAGAYDIGFINAPTVIYHVNSASTGPQSLVNRSVKEIRADWDLLNEKISKSYPTKEAGDTFLKQTYKLAPYSYWGVLKANLRAHNYTNVFQSLYLIIFTYKGLIPLCKLVTRATKKLIYNKIKI